MKRFLGLVIFAAILVMLPACSSGEEKKTLKAPASMGTTDSTDTGDQAKVETFSTVNIDGEKLKITTSLGNEYILNGAPIQEDEGMRLESVREQLHAQIDGNNICPMVEEELTLQFTDKIPQSIKWYNHYYIDADTEDFIYSSLQTSHTADRVEASVTLPVGIDLAGPLSENTTVPKHYRTIRIVCMFDDQTIEYYLNIIG